MNASRVQHIRDLSDEITSVRGWPRCTTVIEKIARIDEWYDALVRSAELRAAVAVWLKRMDGLGAADLIGGADDMGTVPATIGTDEDGTLETGQQTIPRYQEFTSNSGTVAELDPGWEPVPIPGGAPTSQEAQVIAMLMKLVCGALRTSPATLFGDYSGLSFSAGQLAHLQERQEIEERQMMLANQYYTPVYGDFLMARWMGLMSMFGELMPADLDALLYPGFRLRRYQVLDRSKIINLIKEAWGGGLMTWEECRDELGLIGVNPDEVAETWKEDRKRLGLPETPAEGSMAGPPGVGGGPPGGDSDDDEEDDDGDG